MIYSKAGRCIKMYIHGSLLRGGARDSEVQGCVLRNVFYLRPLL